MAWFIQKRGRILGTIERKQGRIRVHRTEVSTLKKQLKAIDVVILSHEVAINPSKVLAVRPMKPRVSGYGQMSRFLITELKAANGTSVPTTDLTIRFLRHLGKDVTTLSLKDMRSRVKKRLRDLAAEDRVVARHVADATGWIAEGYWSFPPNDPED
jgi:hypothetical protein